MTSNWRAPALSRRPLGRDHTSHLSLVPVAWARTSEARAKLVRAKGIGTVHSAAPRAAGSEVSYPRSSGSQGVGSVVNRSGCRSRGDRACSRRWAPGEWAEVWSRLGLGGGSASRTLPFGVTEISPPPCVPPPAFGPSDGWRPQAAAQPPFQRPGPACEVRNS